MDDLLRALTQAVVEKQPGAIEAARAFLVESTARREAAAGVFALDTVRATRR